MNQIPAFFEFVNRTALIIKPKQPFKEWLLNIGSDNQGVEIEKDPMIYLLPDFDETKDLDRWLKKNFDQIFVDQMNYWYTLESMWVQNRTFKMFKEWFDYSLYMMILDTLEEPIEKE
jgi:hypothetical protein